MKGWTMLAAAGAAAVVVIVAGAGIGLASGMSDDDEPLTGSTYDKAVAAALVETGGGTVTETEVGDDGAVYSVEVRLEDGSQREINLDAEFNVIGSEVDDDGPGDDDGPDDD